MKPEQSQRGDMLKGTSNVDPVLLHTAFSYLAAGCTEQHCTGGLYLADRLTAADSGSPLTQSQLPK